MASITIRRLDDAVKTLSLLVKRYPKSALTDSARLRVGVWAYQLRQWAVATEALSGQSSAAILASRQATTSARRRGTSAQEPSNGRFVVE